MEISGANGVLPEARTRWRLTAACAYICVGLRLSRHLARPCLRWRACATCDAFQGLPYRCRFMYRCHATATALACWTCCACFGVHWRGGRPRPCAGGLLAGPPNHLRALAYAHLNDELPHTRTPGGHWKPPVGDLVFCAASLVLQHTISLVLGRGAGLPVATCGNELRVACLLGVYIHGGAGSGGFVVAGHS